MDIDPAKWFEIATHNPIILVTLGGLLFGLGFTQAVKKTWLAFGDATKISVRRYDVSVMWLSILSTFFATHTLWQAVIPIDAHGLNRAVSLVIGIGSPKIYEWVKAIIAWRFPALAARMGNGSEETK